MKNKKHKPTLRKEEEILKTEATQQKAIDYKPCEMAIELETGGKQSYTTLHEAASKGDFQACFLFLDIQAQINTGEKYSNLTPLHLAILGGHYDLAIFLLDRGADILAFDNRGRGVLHMLIEHNLHLKKSSEDDSMRALNLFIELVNRGADLNFRDNEGYTPLLYANLGHNGLLIPIVKSIFSYIITFSTPKSYQCLGVIKNEAEDNDIIIKKAIDLTEIIDRYPKIFADLYQANIYVAPDAYLYARDQYGQTKEEIDLMEIGDNQNFYHLDSHLFT